MSDPAHSATINAQVSANNVKPLVIAKIQDLNLGTVTLGPGVWSNAVVSISQAGALSCTSANVTCTGATSVAQYNVQGSKQSDRADQRAERDDGQPERPDKDADADDGRAILDRARELRLPRDPTSASAAR